MNRPHGVVEHCAITDKVCPTQELPCVDCPVATAWLAPKTFTLADRIESYALAFPKFPRPYLAGNRIEGLWIMGNQYHTSGYYGAYPHGYLDRVTALFPESKVRPVLHVFSGSLPPAPNVVRFDVNSDLKPDVVGDAHNLTSFFPNTPFDFVFADPPYSAEDAEHYGTPMVGRTRVLRECLGVVKPGGWVIWLDQVLPMFNKKVCHLGLAIGMVKSTNHRVRGVFGFQKAASMKDSEPW